MDLGFPVIWYIRAVEALSLIVALVLVALAFGGYRKSGSRTMLSGALGFGMLGVASLVEGVLFEVIGIPLEDAHAFRSTLTVLGLVLLVYSVHRTR
jgi:uncharacterized membrane protein